MPYNSKIRKKKGMQKGEYSTQSQGMMAKKKMKIAGLIIENTNSGTLCSIRGVV